MKVDVIPSSRRWRPRLHELDWRRGARWFAAEFLVVVTGVLVALLLNAWYQDRENRMREERYLQQLVANLRETERLMSQADSVSLQRDRDLKALVRMYRGSAPPVRDSVLLWSLQIGYDNPVPVLGTADALLTTGDINLIRDPAVRAALTSYVSTSRDYLMPWVLQLEDDFIEARTAYRARVDYFEAGALRTASGRTPELERVASFDELGRVDPFPLDMDVLVRDRAVYALLGRMLLAKAQMVAARDELRREARTLRGLVEAYLAD